MTQDNAPIPQLGVRNTRQRAAVVSVLRQMDNFESAKGIYQALLQQGYKVGLTTVYRTLQSLADIHEVDTLNMSNGETLYRHCKQGSHHHHLVCTECGNTQEIEGGPVESWAQEVATQFGYSLTSHDAEVYGQCPECHDAKSTVS